MNEYETEPIGDEKYTATTLGKPKKNKEFKKKSLFEENFQGT